MCVRTAPAFVRYSFRIRAAIEALLDGKPIRPAETKAFGCAIARR